MSAEQAIILLSCDYDGYVCQDTFTAITSSISEAREKARKQGWKTGMKPGRIRPKRSSHVDLCPLHAGAHPK